MNRFAILYENRFTKVLPRFRCDTDLPTASVIRRERRPPTWTGLSALQAQEFRQFHPRGLALSAIGPAHKQWPLVFAMAATTRRRSRTTTICPYRTNDMA